MGTFTYLKRIEVPVAKLEIGMYVAELDKPWQDSSFLFQGFPIEDERQLEQLNNECDYVFVDFKTQEEYDVYLHTLAHAKAATTKAARGMTLAEELPKASAAFRRTLQAISRFKDLVVQQQPSQLSTSQQHLTQPPAPDLTELEACVSDLAASLKRNPDALLLFSNIKNKSRYAVEHCLRVAVLSMAFGQQLGMSSPQIRLLGLGGILHDIGKLLLPAKLLNKPGKLERDEAIALTQYPEQGFRWLTKMVGVSEVVKDIVLSHHEREDGRGYPRHIGKDRVSRDAKIVGIIDAYDAIASDRPYSEAKPVSAAFTLLHEGKGSKYDASLVEEFVRWLGVYPVGSLVEMASGEIGIVLQNRGSRKLTPQLLLVSDESKRPGYQKTIDLGRLASRGNGEPYKIKGLLANHSHDIHIEHFLDRLIRESVGI